MTYHRRKIINTSNCLTKKVLHWIMRIFSLSTSIWLTILSTVCARADFHTLEFIYASVHTNTENKTCDIFSFQKSPNIKEIPAVYNLFHDRIYPTFQSWKKQLVDFFEKFLVLSIGVTWGSEIEGGQNSSGPFVKIYPLSLTITVHYRHS